MYIKILSSNKIRENLLHRDKYKCLDNEYLDLLWSIKSMVYNLKYVKC